MASPSPPLDKGAAVAGEARARTPRSKSTERSPGRTPSRQVVPASEKPLADAPPGLVKVQVYDHLISVPTEDTVSLWRLSRNLRQQLQLGVHAPVQVSDGAGKALDHDEDLAAALRDGRHPLQASMTVGILREIERKRSDVETKKEELSHFQWQVIADRVDAVSLQTDRMSASAQGTLHECRDMVQKLEKAEVARAERMEAVIEREAQQRHAELRDFEAKADRVMIAVCDERTARDVATHQLNAQLEAVVASVEGDRSLRSQEHAELKRCCEDVQLSQEAERARNEERWSSIADTLRRQEARLDERGAAESQLDFRLAQAEATAERLRATLATVELGLASAQRTTQDLIAKAQEETSRAIRGETMGRDLQIARVVKESEISRQALEARVARCQQDAGSMVTEVKERISVLEQRCAKVEKDLLDHMAMMSERSQVLVDETHRAKTTIETVQAGLMSSDVVTKTTASRLNVLAEQLESLGQDCKTRIATDSFKIQVQELKHADLRCEAKLAQLERDIWARWQAETSERDGMKAHFQDSVKSVLDTLTTVGPSPRSAASPGDKLENSFFSSPQHGLPGQQEPMTIAGPAPVGVPVLGGMARGGRSLSPVRPHDIGAPAAGAPEVRRPDGMGPRTSVGRSVSPSRVRTVIVPNTQSAARLPSCGAGTPVRAAPMLPPMNSTPSLSALTGVGRNVEPSLSTTGSFNGTNFVQSVCRQPL